LKVKRRENDGKEGRKVAIEERRKERMGGGKGCRLKGAKRKQALTDTESLKYPVPRTGGVLKRRLCDQGRDR